MAFNINDLRANLNLGGARPTLFNVNLTLPGGVGSSAAARKFTFTCEGAELPASQVGLISVPYFGRIVKFAGDRTFNPWTVTVVNDEDFLVRDAMEAWSSLINTRVTNLRDASSSSPTLYKSSADVTQFDRTGNPIRIYTIQGMWPREIEAIQLSWGQQDQIERFRVTFEYDWFDVSGTTGTGGDDETTTLSAQAAFSLNS
jgi:hypothetical protein